MDADKENRKSRNSDLFPIQLQITIAHHFFYTKSVAKRPWQVQSCHWAAQKTHWALPVDALEGS